MIVFTFDMDWAPSFVLDPVLERLEKYNLKATFFCTDSSEVTNRLDGNPNIELGCHPNFMPDSTQGGSENEIIANMKEWLPAARGIRTHRLYWYSGLLSKLVGAGFKYDVSQFLPFHPHLEPINYGDFNRFPYWWSDNIHVANGLPLKSVDLPNMEKDGLKIFDFHPIHIFLNTGDLAEYRAAMEKLGSIGDRRYEEISKFRRSGEGIGSFFDALCKYVADRQPETRCMKELLT